MVVVDVEVGGDVGAVDVVQLVDVDDEVLGKEVVDVTVVPGSVMVVLVEQDVATVAPGEAASPPMYRATPA